MHDLAPRPPAVVPPRAVSALLPTILALTCLLALPAGAAPASAKQARVRAAEPVEGLRFVPRMAARRRLGHAPRREGRLTFQARGRRFALDLRENEELLARLKSAQREALRGRHELYEGELPGEPGSWVRLSRSGSQWRGLVFDGEELLAVEPADALGQAGGGAATGLRMYSLRDLELSGSCALDPEAEAAPSLQGMLDGLEGLPEALPPGAASELEVTLLGDPAFSADHADPEAEALALFNAVDGLYSQQVGVSIRVVDVILLPDDQGLDATSSSLLLGQLRSLVASGAVANPGLVHLLTGRDLDGGTIGIAYLSVLCHPSYGVGLSQVTLGSLAAHTVLIAHELGHNFGAPHDNQSGSVCASTPGGYVMNPSLNGAADEFSSCSLQQMAAEVAGASCLVEPSGTPACSNGIDDDGDGSTDFGSDMGCLDPDDPSEETECRDGLDNDGDGLTDYPEDPECLDAEQWLESDPACGFGGELVPLLLPLMAWHGRGRRRRRAARR